MSDVIYPVRVETALSISASVGSGGSNRLEDVRVIQNLLNANAGHMQPFVKLDVDGRVGAKTIGAITRFQKVVLGKAAPDGRVDPGKATIERLVALLRVPGGPTAPEPTPVVGGAFAQRLNRFQLHVLNTFSINLRANSQFRTEQTQSQWHAAHMIRFNGFNRRPVQSELFEGRNVIAFSHLSNPQVVWGNGLDFSNYLRDHSNMPCRKTPDGRAWVNPPDANRTRDRARALLAGWGVGTPKDKEGNPIGPANSAQVAPGVAGCVEPCRCGGSRSKHVAGMAADLDSGDMEKLMLKLTPATRASIDTLLATYGLHRPVANEPWHVESNS